MPNQLQPPELLGVVGDRPAQVSGREGFSVREPLQKPAAVII
jgi:hypothetical protein